MKRLLFSILTFAAVSVTWAVISSEDGTIISNPLDGYEWVDLGLPSGTLWATCNIGAGSPEDRGSFFAWGETKTKESYADDTYIYELPSDATELEPSADAATVIRSSNWQMPNAEQLDELINKQYTMVKKIVGDDESIGYQITSKSNGNSIFLPHAGFKYDAKREDSLCFYWSRSVGSDNHGYCLWGYGGVLRTSSSVMIRSYGSAVRPVVKSQR